MAQRPKPVSKGEPAGTPIRPISLEDFEVIERVKAGETEAFGHLVERYQDRVFNACWRITGNLEDARDVAQDAFLKTLDKITSFRQESGFYTFVFRVAVNLAISLRRKRARTQTVSLDQDQDGMSVGEALGLRSSDGAQPSQKMTQAELQSQIAKALQSLDDDQRAVVVLRDIEDFDYAEIAQILDIPIGTVKSRLYRARLALRDAVSLPHTQ